MNLFSVLNPFRRVRFPALAFTLIAIANSFPASAQSRSAHAVIPSTYVGMWQVTAVHTDSGATRTLHYHQNDLRLVGRIFSIASGHLITNAPEEENCDTPGIASRWSDVTGLIEASMGGRALPPERPTANDYGLRISNVRATEAVTVQCKDRLWGASLGRENGIAGAWMMKLSDDVLAIRWYDETILQLKRMPENTTPKASFDCNKAGVVSEKAICASIPLATLDQSIARSYAIVAKQFNQRNDTDAFSRLQSGQRGWLNKRNRCGSDKACLHEAMTVRMEELNTISDQD